MRLLAFPYAYGNAAVYNELKKFLLPEIELIAFNTPGHGERYCEELLYTINDIVNDLLIQIDDYLDEPYAMLGYSMGSLLTYEIYLRLKKENKRLPEYLFFLAGDSPLYIGEQKDYESYGFKEVRNELYDKKGTSEALMENNELIELMIPIVKADLIAMRDYNCDEKKCSECECDAIVIRGSEEKEISNCHQEWESVLRKKVDYFLMPGEHFFLFDEESDNYRILKKIILKKLSVPAARKAVGARPFNHAIQFNQSHLASN